MTRGKSLTDEEICVIKIGLENGCKVADIAKLINRPQITVYKRISRMNMTGKSGSADE